MRGTGCATKGGGDDGRSAGGPSSARGGRASRRSAPSATERARQLSEDERAATMQVLQESRRKTAEALRRMPLQLNGDGQIKRSEALNAKLDEIERAIELFNREVVFVRKRA